MFDYLIIGGGVVGSAVFNVLISRGKKCALVEKELDLATGCSKANSGLIHAGFDAKEGTLKAKLNVRGAQMIERTARRLGISYKKTGAIVVGDDLEALNKLYVRGKNNGVKNLKILSPKQIKKVCPNLKKQCPCLYAKTAGVISPYMLTIALAEEGCLNGGQVFLNTKITKVEHNDNCFDVLCEDKTLQAKNIINCAGFGFNEVSNLIGAENYDLKFRRGQYFVLDNCESKFVNLSVFPLPSKLGKGILATPTIDGNILLGPTAEEGENNTQVTALGLDEITKNIANMFNKFPSNIVIREFSGVRCYSGEDFIIEKSQKVKNVINVAGICSPGLSSAVAIGEYVAEMENLNSKIKMKKRTPVPCLKNMTMWQKNRLISKNPDFGKIICRCENVSLGEINMALTSPVPPTTVDGLKRRVRAGMGRCQGGFCQSRILQILARSQNTKLTSIKKEYEDSNVARYEVKGGER